MIRHCKESKQNHCCWKYKINLVVAILKWTKLFQFSWVVCHHKGNRENVFFWVFIVGWRIKKEDSKIKTQINILHLRDKHTCTNWWYSHTHRTDRRKTGHWASKTRYGWRCDRACEWFCCCLLVKLCVPAVQGKHGYFFICRETLLQGQGKTRPNSLIVLKICDRSMEFKQLVPWQPKVPARLRSPNLVLRLKTCSLNSQ